MVWGIYFTILFLGLFILSWSWRGAHLGDHLEGWPLWAGSCPEGELLCPPPPFVFPPITLKPEDTISLTGLPCLLPLLLLLHCSVDSASLTASGIQSLWNPSLFSPHCRATLSSPRSSAIYPAGLLPPPAPSPHCSQLTSRALQLDMITSLPAANFPALARGLHHKVLHKSSHLQLGTGHPCPSPASSPCFG